MDVTFEVEFSAQTCIYMFMIVVFKLVIFSLRIIQITLISIEDIV